jgi:molybdopterin molybdotransferase
MKRAVTAEELSQPLIPYEDARRLVVGSFHALEPVRVPLDDALGLVAAADVSSAIDVPGFASSAMDGYAVRSVDTAEVPVTLRIVGDAPAGGALQAGPGPGEAVKIMTGGVVPDGADAIVPWEDTEQRGDEIVVVRATIPQRYVRPAGEDVPAGGMVVARGDALTAVHLGVLASIGNDDVAVHPRPRVAILSTGDELDEPGSALQPGHVYDANATLLTAMARSAGATVASYARIPDDPGAITAWMRDVSERADLIVTSGGASVGEHDWLREVLSSDGRLDMWRVAMKPGKPVALGSLGGTPVLALPGNPGSAYACAHTFVVPAIRVMCGREPSYPTVRARMTEAVPGSPSRTQLTRVRVDGDACTPLPAQSSVVLSNLLGADGFAIVQPGGLPAGAEVTVELFD